MGEIRLTGAEIGCIAAFQRVTKALAKDCIINEDNSITFVVGPHDMGLAIGKNGANIKQAEKILKKGVTVVEYSEDPVKFIKNVMYPIRPKTINIEGKDSNLIAKISVEKRDRASVIGSRGRNIQRIKNLVSRHHDIGNIVVI